MLTPKEQIWPQHSRYCESCGRLRTDVKWHEDTEQYECEECYQWYLEHK